MNIQTTLEEFNKQFPDLKKCTEDENDTYNGEIEAFIEQALTNQKQEIIEMVEFEKKDFIHGGLDMSVQRTNRAIDNILQKLANNE